MKKQFKIKKETKKSEEKEKNLYQLKTQKNVEKQWKIAKNPKNKEKPSKK